MGKGQEIYRFEEPRQHEAYHVNENLCPKYLPYLLIRLKNVLHEIQGDSLNENAFLIRCVLYFQSYEGYLECLLSDTAFFLNNFCRRGDDQW